MDPAHVRLQQNIGHQSGFPGLRPHGLKVLCYCFFKVNCGKYHDYFSAPPKGLKNNVRLIMFRACDSPAGAAALSFSLAIRRQIDIPFALGNDDYPLSGMVSPSTYVAALRR